MLTKVIITSIIVESGSARRAKSIWTLPASIQVKYFTDFEALPSEVT